MFPSSFLHHVLQSFYKYKTRVTILMWSWAKLVLSFKVWFFKRPKAIDLI
jgi:hypothetical protein